MKLEIGSMIKTTRGPAEITKVGPLQYSPRSAVRWAIATVKLRDDEVAYCAVHENELAEVS